MSDRELKAIISATDKASPVFKQVASGADKMGTSVESASKKGAKGLSDQSKSATDMSAKMAALGAVTATAAGVLAGWARSSEDAAAIQRQLEASIAATGEEYATYAERIAEAGERAVQLGMDDEAASQAISALTQVTGSANTALDQMGLVMDLAAAKHMSLESAAELVGKVLDGNIGILNRQGFAIDENATATEALAQVQQAVAGQAEASATTYGRLREEFSNLTDQIGATAGEFAPLLAMLPGASVAFSTVGAAVGALGLSLGPVGIAAAVGIAAVAIDKLIDGTKEFEASAGTARVVANDFAEALVKLKTGGSEATDEFTKVTGAFAELLTQQIEAVELATAGAVDKISNDEANKIRDAIIGIFSNPMIDEAKASEAILKLFSDFSKGIIDDSGDLATAIGSINTNWASYAKGIDEAATKTKDFSGIMSDLQSAISDVSAVKMPAGLLDDIATITEFGGTDARMALQSYFDQFKRTGDIDTFTSRADAVADAVERQGAAAVHATAKMKQQEAAAYSMAEAAKTFTSATQGQTVAEAEAEAKMIDLEAAAYSMAAAQQDVAVQTNAVRAEFDAATASAKEFIATIPGIGSLAGQLRPLDIDVRGGDKVTGTAADLQKTSSILGSVLGTFKQLDSLGQASEEAGSIAENLVGEPGELAMIDRLLKQNRISQDEYNAAIEAGSRISKEQGAIENDLNTIRAKQLPLLADADRQYGNLIDRISHMNAEQATATLGFMDTNESLQAQNLLALAASASMGELGANGEAAATSIIEGAVAADPVLEQMLTQIGLISRDHEGNLVVNFDNADTLKSSTDALTASIDALTLALGGVPPSAHSDVTVSGAGDGTAQVNGLIAALNQLDDMHAVATTTLTNTVNNVTNNTTTNTVKNALRLRLGGIVPHAYARDGITTAGLTAVTVGEAGRETAFLPGGTYVRNAAATAAAGGGRELTLVLKNYGAIHGFAGVDEVMAAFKTAAREHFAGFRG